MNVIKLSEKEALGGGERERERGEREREGERSREIDQRKERAEKRRYKLLIDDLDHEMEGGSDGI